MVVFLYGADGFRSKQKLKEIIGSYKEKHKSGLNLIYLDASQIGFGDFYDIFRSSSMFDEKKLIVLNNVFFSKDFQEAFLKEIKNLEQIKDVVVIYENQQVDQRLKLFKMLLKECKSQNFELLDSMKLKKWAAKEFEGRGAKINADALNELVGNVGNNLWQLNSEIEKLVNYKKGAVDFTSRQQNGTVKKEDVRLLVKPKIENDIFKTIDALAEKNKTQALALLQKHLQAGDHPLYLLTMITWGFKNLLVVKELAEKRLMYNSIVKKSGLHPFVVKKNYFICRQFSLAELKAIYKKIYQTDLAVKTGKIEPETAINLLVSQI